MGKLPPIDRAPLPISQAGQLIMGSEDAAHAGSQKTWKIELHDDFLLTQCLMACALLYRRTMGWLNRRETAVSKKKYQRFRCHVETSAHARCLSLRGRGVTLIFKCRAHGMFLKFLHHESGCTTTVRNGVTKFRFSLKRLINLLADIMCPVECCSESAATPVKCHWNSAETL